jgi:ATP-dependent DNA helicase 2 subunit 1
LGDHFVPLKPKQITELKHFDDPVIRIIGFKPTSAIEPWMNVTHSVFLYPTDSDYIGSVRGFTSLYKSMLKLDKVAIAWAVLRRNSSPMVCALYPAPEETSDLNGTEIQTSPPGLHLIRLPFADDIRQRPEVSPVKASDSLIDSFKKIVTTLTMPKGYESDRYQNPRLQWFYRLLQSTALDEELPNIPADSTLPKYNSINTKAGDFISDFNKRLEAEFELLLESKRGAAEEEDGRVIKRPKVSSQLLLEADIKHAIKNSNLKKYTVKQLSDFAKSKGITTESRKKQDYIDAIEKVMI